MLWWKQWLKAFSVKNKNFLFLRTSVRTSKVFFCSLWTSNLFFSPTENNRSILTSSKDVERYPWLEYVTLSWRKTFLPNQFALLKNSKIHFNFNLFKRRLSTPIEIVYRILEIERKACFATILLHHSSLFINKKTQN